MNRSNVQKFIAATSVVLSSLIGQVLLASEDLQTFPSYLDTGYNQKYRPQFHFTSRKNWLNDPNGMVYYDGEYHLFFQHKPTTNQVPDKSWGHAVSQDMVHWEQLPHAIQPYGGGVIWSGTAAVDHNNTLGKQKGDIKTLLACFTLASNTCYQALAYSTDKGRTFELFNEGKAVVPNQGFDPKERDPKLFWHEPTKKWVMILWVRKSITDADKIGRGSRRYKNKPNRPSKVRFFTSDNLTDWTVASDFHRDWTYECMDFVHLPVDGDPNNKTWLLFDASFDYEMGEFDGRTFTTDKKVGLGDFGKNFYAAQTFNDSPDGRTVVIGWMRYSDFDQVGMPFNQQMSFPTTMELRTTPDGIKLFRWPIKEIESLYTKKHEFTNRPIEALASTLGGIKAELIDASIEFDPKETGNLEWTLRGLKVVYQADKQQFFLKTDTLNMPPLKGKAKLKRSKVSHLTHLAAPAVNGKVKLRVLVDRGSIELFANDGAAVATHFALPDPENRSITLSGNGSVSLVINELKSSWHNEFHASEKLHHDASTMALSRHEKEFAVSASYLLLPIQNKGKKEKLTLCIDGKVVLDYNLVLASGPERTDWYAFFSIERFKGKRAQVAVSLATDEGFALVKQSDAIPGEESFYKEPLRPQFHFTSKTGWLNDPNGLIYYKGEYHMYYQHNPVGLPWGNMTWGHAVSRDLVHWKEQPKVLFPDANGTCFSGAAFIDQKNQLGKKTGKDDVIVAFYLRTKIGLCLAYSNDRGQTFTDYEKNPVLNNEGARIDTPRPFWYEPTKRWIAPTYDHFKDKNGRKLRAVGFYSSENLKDWKFESRVEQDKWGDELCGCVDFFQLPVDGDRKNRKWVMIMIDGSYILGSFDGHKFYTLEGKPAVTSDRIQGLVKGSNYYATMTWHNVPKDRRVQITWMRARGGKYPGMPFNQQMTLPSELTLHSTDEGPRLRMNPIKELEKLRTKTHKWKNIVLKVGENPLAELKGDLFDLEVEFEPLEDSDTIFDMRGITIQYNAKTQILSRGRVRSKLKPIDGVIRLRILLDRSSIEVYGNDGRVYMPCIALPKKDNLSLGASCTKGEVKVNHLRVHELKSSWE